MPVETPIHRRGRCIANRPQTICTAYAGRVRTTQQARRAGHKWRRRLAARLGTGYHVLQNNVPHARAEVQVVVSSGRHATVAGGERVWVARVGQCAGQRGPYAGLSTPAVPLIDALGVIHRDVVAPVSRESETVPQEGRRAKKQG